MVPARPETSRWPRTENTTAGSVGATAVATSSDTYQARPNAKCASSAAATTVKNVPSTPVMAIGTAADRTRAQPMSMPPSNKMQAKATVTTRVTVCCEGPCTAGTTLAAMAAPTRNSAGAGSLTRSANRLDSTATSPTAAITTTSRANGSASGTTVLLRDGHG